MNIPQKIEALRHAMARKGLEAYIIPSTDPHISEYIAEHWKCREWISGFDGSAGTVVVTLEDAALWTDSRYFIQAEQQLDFSEFELFKMGLPDTPDMIDWIVQQIPAESQVGVDGSIFATNEIFRIGEKLAQNGLQLNPDYDLFEEVWRDRPALPMNEIFSLPVEFSGVSAFDKIALIREDLKKSNAEVVLFTSLDEVAWIFNIRGHDVDYNPVALAYAVISLSEAILFVDAKKVNADMSDTLRNDGILIADYSKITEFLEMMPYKTMLFDGNRTNYALRAAVNFECNVIEKASPVLTLKSVKNCTELDGFRKAMVKDGVALVRFFRWLEEEVHSGEVTETTIAERLYEYRDEQEYFVCESFSTIAGYAEHGAIIHYRATTETSSVIQPNSFLLLDSGGQYFDGTTDITRTIALGEPTEQMKSDYTLVLKGHIALASCCFPEGTKGTQLDILARKSLWEQGLNYGHGTGHGVGHFLSVHEGPQSIRIDENKTPLQPGMVISNEPGIYRKDEYGIRLENLVVVSEKMETTFGKFFSFETLTLYPFDKKSIDISLLNPSEIQWIDDYHQTVFEKLSPHLDETEQEWLKEKTSPLGFGQEHLS